MFIITKDIFCMYISILGYSFNFYYSIPQSASEKKKKLMRLQDIRPTKTPNCDIVAKIILDSLNNVAYADDSQVVELIVNKWYSENPRVEVEIEAIQKSQTVLRKLNNTVLRKCYIATKILL